MSNQVELTAKLDISAFKNELYELIHTVSKQVIQDLNSLNDLPYMLSRAQLAKHVFNVSVPSLDAHIVRRTDFPKFQIGERVVYPKDDVILWIQKNIDVVERHAPDRKVFQLA